MDGCNKYGSPNDLAYSEVAIIRANESGKNATRFIGLALVVSEGAVYPETLEEFDHATKPLKPKSCVDCVKILCSL